MVIQAPFQLQGIFTGKGKPFKHFALQRMSDKSTTHHVKFDLGRDADFCFHIQRQLNGMHVQMPGHGNIFGYIKPIFELPGIDVGTAVEIDQFAVVVPCWS